jgi:hypothetical protein
MWIIRSMTNCGVSPDGAAQDRRSNPAAGDLDDLYDIQV